MTVEKDKNFIEEQVGLVDPADVHEFLVATTAKVFDIKLRPRGVRVLTDGDVILIDKYGTSVTYPSLAGDVIPFRVKEIAVTTTTSDIVFWW